MTMPTTEELREALSYDEESGFLFWSKSRGSIRAGARAGFKDRNGYYYLRFNRRAIPIHRIVYFLFEGVWPELVDHIDGDISNNRISNLRPCDKSQNGANASRSAANTSGFKGSHFHRQSGRYRAQITVRGKVHSLGLFDTAEAAHNAYQIAARKFFGPYARNS